MHLSYFNFTIFYQTTCQTDKTWKSGTIIAPHDCVVDHSIYDVHKLSPWLKMTEQVHSLWFALMTKSYGHDDGP